MDFRWCRNIICRVWFNSDFLRTMALGPSDSQLFPCGRQLLPYHHRPVHLSLQVWLQEVISGFLFQLSVLKKHEADNFHIFRQHWLDILLASPPFMRIEVRIPAWTAPDINRRDRITEYHSEYHRSPSHVCRRRNKEKCICRPFIRHVITYCFGFVKCAAGITRNEDYAVCRDSESYEWFNCLLTVGLDVYTLFFQSPEWPHTLLYNQNPICTPQMVQVVCL